MNILAFDTCLGAVSAAVRWRSARGDWMLREAYEACTSGHAERLFPMIAEVMEGAGLEFSAIDRIAVTLGPGTFTGVRGGIAAARAIALATGRPVVGMTSLEVMAHRGRLQLGPRAERRPLAVAVDARRGMLYLQTFDERGGASSSAVLVSPQQAVRAIADLPFHVVGSGAAAVAALAGPQAEASLPDLQPHARFLAMAAPSLAPIESVAPLYLRQPDAKPSQPAPTVQP